MAASYGVPTSGVCKKQSHQPPNLAKLLHRERQGEPTSSESLQVPLCLPITELSCG